MVHKDKSKGFNVFLIANVKAIKEKMEHKKLRMGAMKTVANSMWNKLTEKEKLCYEGIKACGKTPLDVYYEKVRKKDDSLNFKEAKTKWDTLPISEREKFIKKSAKLKMAGVNTEEDVEVENFDVILGPSERELSDYLAVHGMPEKPSQSLHISYLRKCGEYNDKLRIPELTKLANKKFNELSDEEKIYWTRKHEKSHKKYEKRLKMWEGTLDEVEKYMLKLFLQSRERSNSSKSSKMESAEKLNTVIMPLIRMEFDIKLSQIPAITALQVYKQEVKERTGKTPDRYDSQKHVTRLNQIEKKALQAKGEKNKVDFIKKVKSYVESLSEEKRSIFLGQNRLPFMKKLKEDIFENDFPCSKYPVYLKSNNSKETTKNKIASPENQKDAEVEMPKKSRKKQNFYKDIESTLSEIFEDIDLEHLFSKTDEETKNKLNTSGRNKNYSTNDKIDKNNNDSKKIKDDRNNKVVKLKENARDLSNEKSKRKRSNSFSECKKRRKLNNDEDNLMVKVETDSDDDEDEKDINLVNISKYLNSLEFENTDTKLECDVEKSEFEFYENE
ncbi:hypothetical protein Anas_03155 [Armadillidium nasatum]|uniref:Uncharacterized protein n=1 Tax=Armadillidium nasatum TaxID=96803 RepID=A0A5N5STN5_9CRUS|nr:hypothetical protein Anas_03155 [Armadillidium nasatum]